MKIIIFKICFFLFFISNNIFSQIAVSIVRAPSYLSLRDDINKEYQVEITNSDTVNYLLYNITDPYISMGNLCCNSDVINNSAAFSWVKVFDAKQKIILDYTKRREIYASAYLPQNIEDSGEMKAYYRSCINDKLILKSKEKICFNFKLNIANLNIKTGTYFIQYLYTNGSNLKMFVDKDVLIRDEMLFNAKVFYGCIQSNSFELRIKK